jgi:hypothetical protein
MFVLNRNLQCMGFVKVDNGFEFVSNVPMEFIETTVKSFGSLCQAVSANGEDLQ